MTVTLHKADLIRRLTEQQRALDPESPQLKRAFTLIAIKITMDAKMNIQRQGIIDNGVLLNSIRWEMFKEGSVSGVRVGSFGVKYAAMNEFGGAFTDRQRRAMFASLARLGKLKKGYEGKGVITKGHWHPRPYLIPAYQVNGPYIIDTIRAALAGKGG